MKQALVSDFDTYISGTTATLTNKTITTPIITTPLVNAGLQLKNGATSAGFVEFFEDSDNGQNKATLIGPASTADVTLTLPAATDTLVGKATTDTLTNKTLSGGSITSGFGNIDTGASTITTTGLISGGSLDIDNVLIDGATIGHTDDTDLITLSNGVVTVDGELDATTLDISGAIDVAGNSVLATLDVTGAVDMASTLQVDGIATFTVKSVANAGASFKNGASSAGFIEFFEDSDNGTNKVTLIGPASTADVTLTLPAAAGIVATTDDATALAIALG